MGMLIVCLCVLLLMIGIVVGTLIIVFKRFKGNGIAMLAGALSFFIMQFILRIPAMQFIFSLPAAQVFAAEQPALTGFLQAFTAGLFEGVGRLLFGWLFLRKVLLPSNGVRLGAAHAVTETTLIGVTTYLNNVIFAVIVLMPDVMNAMVAQMPQLGATFELFTQPQSFGMYFVAAYERFIVVFAQIGLGIIAVYALYKKSFKYALLMLGLHTALDSSIVVCTMLGIDIRGNIVLVEAFITIISLVVFYIGCGIYKKWRNEAIVKASI